MKIKKTYLQQVPRLLQFLQNSLGVHQLSLFQSSTVNYELKPAILIISLVYRKLFVNEKFKQISQNLGQNYSELSCI